MQDDEPCVLDELDKCCPLIIDKVLPHLPVQDKVRAVVYSKS